MSRPLEYHRHQVWPGELESDYESPLDIAERLIREQWQFTLPRAIPDDPDYRKHVPIEYRLNAKAIVFHMAGDLSKGQSAQTWVELADLGVAAAEIFAEVPVLLTGAGALLGLVGSFLALGAGEREAAEKVGADWSARGLSRGVVVGADKRRARELMDYFGNLYFPKSHVGHVAAAYHRVGLASGYLQGRRLTQNQRVIFWRDLGSRMGDQSGQAPRERWGPRKAWSDWYAYVAGAFNRYHVVHSE